MLLKNTFDVPRTPDETWLILLDVPGIVGCIPGAQLTSVEPDGAYRGNVSVRLGPVALKFNGMAKLEDVDNIALTAVIHAKGSDRQGRGKAGATARMQVVPSQTGSTVLIETDLQLSGLVAQYGRASGVMTALANEIVSSFAEALRAQLVEAVDSGGPAKTFSPAASKSSAPIRTGNRVGASLLWRAFVGWLRRLIFGAKS